MISAEARAAIATMRAEPRKSNTPNPPVDRAEWEQRAEADPPPADVAITADAYGGVACEWVRAPEAAEDGLLLLLHGGGYVSGSPLTHRKLAYYLSQAARLPVLVPDYRLAPENPAPSAIEDSVTVWEALLEAGSEAGRVVVAGDSAGGGLAMSLLLALRDAKQPLPAAGFLMSPWTDLACTSPSYHRNIEIDPSMNVLRLRSAGRMYSGALDIADPSISPVSADLSGLPPLLIHVGGDEVMRDDSTRLAENIRYYGGIGEIAIFGGLWHVFHNHVPVVPEASDAIAEAGRFLRRHLR